MSGLQGVTTTTGFPDLPNDSEVRKVPRTIVAVESLYLRGSKYPIFEDSGPKNHTLNGFWDQGP